MMSDKHVSFRQAFRITIIYLIIGCLWILLSDQLLSAISTDPVFIMAISIAKGWFFVLATSVLLFSLIYPTFRSIVNSNAKTKLANIELERTNAQLKSLYEDYQRKQILLKSLINSIPDLIFYKDPNSVFIGCNKAFEKYIGKSENELIGLTDYEIADRESAENYRKMDADLIVTQSTLIFEEAILDPVGNKVYLETLKSPYYDSSGNIIGLIGISRDVSERKFRDDKIQYLNYHDSLTGLFNRTFFQIEQDRLDNAHQLPLSVIVGDINGLRLINETLGHADGDRLIIEIANVLKSCCRSEDIIARTGGDEFSILLPSTDSQAAYLIIERINTAFEKFMNNADKSIFHTNISLGYATKIEIDQPFSRIIQIAIEFMNKRKLLEDKSQHSSILSSIKTTMFEKSNETEEHAERLAELSKKLGRVLGLTEEDLVALELLSTLHDIGKISIDLGILTKAGKLTDDEWAQIKKHPAVGYRITQSSPELRHISEYILSHHERWDGLGYPHGLAGEDIPLLSRILSVVDAYDAMTEDRSYRSAMTSDDAIDEIRKNAGTQFDPQIAAAFIDQVLN